MKIERRPSRVPQALQNGVYTLRYLIISSREITIENLISRMLVLPRYLDARRVYGVLAHQRDVVEGDVEDGLLHKIRRNFGVLLDEAEDLRVDVLELAVPSRFRLTLDSVLNTLTCFSRVQTRL